ncbi:hypothetical protein [Candidatus Electronema sp. PJ]|uniref:hypothetical protein n=1 Tax=Candidatus Electronema sp. PJ TaxID=3401572 RepID=UPI003AA8BA3E
MNIHKKTYIFSFLIMITSLFLLMISNQTKSKLVEDIFSSIFTGSIVTLGVSVISYLHERNIFFSKLYYDLLSLYIRTNELYHIIIKLIIKIDKNTPMSEGDVSKINRMPEEMMKIINMKDNIRDSYLDHYTPFLPFNLFEKRTVKSIKNIKYNLFPYMDNLNLFIHEFVISKLKLENELKELELKELSRNTNSITTNKNSVINTCVCGFFYFKKHDICTIAERSKKTRDYIEGQLLNILRNSDGYESLFSSYYEVDLLRKRFENDKKIIEDSQRNKL